MSSTNERTKGIWLIALLALAYQLYFRQGKEEIREGQEA